MTQTTLEAIAETLYVLICAINGKHLSEFNPHSIWADKIRNAITHTLKQYGNARLEEAAKELKHKHCNGPLGEFNGNYAASYVRALMDKEGV